MISNLKLAGMLIGDARSDGLDVVLITDSTAYAERARLFFPGLRVVGPKGSTGRVDLAVVYTQTYNREIDYIKKDN
jgi:hypothetical protein